CALPISERLDGRAPAPQLSQHDVDAFLVNRAQAGIRETQADPAILALDPEPTALKVRQAPPPGARVLMRNVVAHHRGLSCDLTDSSHRSLLHLFVVSVPQPSL